MPSKPKTRAQLNALRIKNAKKKTLNSNTPKNKPKSGMQQQMKNLDPKSKTSQSDRPKTESVNRISPRGVVRYRDQMGNGPKPPGRSKMPPIQKKEKAFKAHKMYSVKTAKTMKEHLALKKKGYSHTKK